MSRWSRKSEAEKREILEAQEQQRRNAQQHESNVRSNYNQIATDYEKKLNDKDAPIKIFENQELPIFCPKDGWVACHKYRLHKKEMMGKTYLALSGNCKICNCPITKALIGDEAYMMMVIGLAGTLIEHGRFEDERTKE